MRTLRTKRVNADGDGDGTIRGGRPIINDLRQIVVSENSNASTANIIYDPITGIGQPASQLAKKQADADAENSDTESSNFNITTVLIVVGVTNF